MQINESEIPFTERTYTRQWPLCCGDGEQRASARRDEDASTASGVRSRLEADRKKRHRTTTLRSASRCEDPCLAQLERLGLCQEQWKLSAVSKFSPVFQGERRDVVHETCTSTRNRRVVVHGCCSLKDTRFDSGPCRSDRGQLSDTYLEAPDTPPEGLLLEILDAKPMTRAKFKMINVQKRRVPLRQFAQGCPGWKSVRGA